MPTTVNEQAVDALTIEELKNIAGLHPMSAGLSVQNQVTNQQAVDAITRDALAQTLLLSRQSMADSIAFQRAVTARAVRFAFDISAEQARAFEEQISRDLEETNVRLGAAASAVEQQAKIAAATPRETALPIEESLTRINAALEAILARIEARPSG